MSFTIAEFNQEPVTMSTDQLMPQPPSLEGHVIPDDRVAQIGPLMSALSATAIAISDQLPLQADAGDFAATLEAEPE